MLSCNLKMQRCFINVKLKLNWIKLSENDLNILEKKN